MISPIAIPLFFTADCYTKSTFHNLAQQHKEQSSRDSIGKLIKKNTSLHKSKSKCSKTTEWVHFCRVTSQNSLKSIRQVTWLAQY